MAGVCGLDLPKGRTCVLSFDASASIDVFVLLVVQPGTAPYVSPLNEDLVLSPTMQSFSYTFTPNATMPNGQVTFQRAGRADAFTAEFDNIF